MFGLVTVKLDDSPLSQFAFCTPASFLQMTPPDVENTPEEPHSHAARLEEYRWFFERFQHSLAPKIQINRKAMHVETTSK